MNLVVKNIIRLILFMFIQVFVLQKIPPLHQFIVPYFYFVFILWLPFRISRMQLLFVAFLTGMLLDFFYKTPGLHAASCSFIAYIRPYLITLLLPKEATEWGNQEPTSKIWVQFLIDLYDHHDAAASFLDDILGVDAIWELFVFSRKNYSNFCHQLAADIDCGSFHE